MTQRENLFKLLRKEKFDFIPVEFMLCPSLVERYKKETGSELSYQDYFEMPWRNISWPDQDNPDIKRFHKYHPVIDASTEIDSYGIGHRSTPTSMHMTQMLCPLKDAQTLGDIENYPLPTFSLEKNTHIAEEVRKLHERGIAAVGNMQCTIWETAWYLRGMENLMMDMMTDDPMATALFDMVTESSLQRAIIYAKSGVDIVFMGDDIGMQSSIMMSHELYTTLIYPRLAKIIKETKKIRPDILVFYHSCGYIEPFIPYLIEAGIDVLNPVQPECMDFETLYTKYSDKLSFHGTVGTQSTMPLGTPEEIKKISKNNLDIAKKGGLVLAPTHLLEPDVPWENIMAYVEACRNYK